MGFLNNLFASAPTITPEQAYRMMLDEPEHVVLDVRSPAEHRQAHIKGDKLIPAQEVRSRAGSELPDKDGLILVYCASGMRASGAVKELQGMGYTNVYSFGGLGQWPYGIVSG